MTRLQTALGNVVQCFAILILEGFL